MSEDRVHPFSSELGLIEWGDWNCRRCRRWEACDLVEELMEDYEIGHGISLVAARRIGWDAEFDEITSECGEREVPR